MQTSEEKSEVKGEVGKGWRSVGYARLSKTGKTVLVYLPEENSVRMVVLNVEELFDLVSKHVGEVNVIEHI